MENIIKLLIVEQIKEKEISLREIHRQIEDICNKDKSREWFSLSTLDRRINNPYEITEKELYLIRDAIKNIVTDASWIHMKRSITDAMRRGYSHKIEEAVNNGFALHQNILRYRMVQSDANYSNSILMFYRCASQRYRYYWKKVLNTYLMLPDIAKASVMCSAYIGRSIKENEKYNKKIMNFIDRFPVFQGISIINELDPVNTRLLGDIIKASTYSVKNIEKQYYEYAVDRNNIVIKECHKAVAGEKEFVKTALKYKHSVIDYSVNEKDYIHGLSFMLFLSKEEWLLAYVTSVYFIKLNAIEDRYSERREYHDKGCTGFKFTDNELDYLCELLYTIEN